MISIHCPGPADTASLGARLAAHLRPGDVVALCGPLGSGKTLFTGGVASGLGVEEPVTSPSFILVRQYTSGFLPLIHADVYRLSSRNEFDDLDLIDDAADGILVIEWADAIEGALPPDHLRVEFVIDDDDSRVVTLDGSPARWQEMATELQA
ncbi:MAG TPA: tRNA (adenosine(37)-N6)-threonylcarbamoyltransferase complex ATPase subunit type 1 TsaE [Acidimicrobiia bacterium]|nr:tRNA (adenosine(37)-N6)-threonylcarbamoyltransferase complex ATPase subunit type 1 TsaE [Acidimicrobiia bacterium]